MKVKKLVTIAVMVSLASVLAILESFIPTGIPGVKLGLANVCCLTAFYLYGEKEAFLIQIIRIFLVGLIFSGILSVSFLLSLSGGLVSYLLMFLFFKLKKFSIYTISIVGAIGHSITQILVSMIILSSSAVLLYLPIILSLSIPSGFLTAIVSSLVLRTFKIEMKKPNLIPISIFSLVFLASLTSFILMYSYKKNEEEGTVATITYQNEEILKINLSKPTDYTVYCSDEIFKGMVKEDSSCLFNFYIYNKDEKDNFNLIVEVNDKGEIRIKEETSKKHICSKTGFIKNKYESLVCLPNSFIVSLDDYSLDEIDAIM